MQKTEQYFNNSYIQRLSNIMNCRTPIEQIPFQTFDCPLWEKNASFDTCFYETRALVHEAADQWCSSGPSVGCVIHDAKSRIFASFARQISLGVVRRWIFGDLVLLHGEAKSWQEYDFYTKPNTMQDENFCQKF